MRWDISSNFKSQKTAHRAAKRPPAGNQKLSKITSGYGGLMIPLDRIRATPKNGGYMVVAQKNEYFWAKNEPWRPPRRPPCNVFNTKTLPLWYSVMTVTKKLDVVMKKLIWGQKTAFLSRSGPENPFLSTLRQSNPLVSPQTDPT